MQSDEHDSHGNPDRERWRWLVPASLSFIGVIFGSRYIKFPVALLAQGVAAMPTPLWLSRRLRWLWIGFFVLYPIELLFTSLTVYLVLSAVGLVLGIATIAVARPRKLSLALLLLGLLAIAALPFVHRYRPAVTVEPGVVNRGRVATATISVPGAGGLHAFRVTASAAGAVGDACATGPASAAGTVRAPGEAGAAVRYARHAPHAMPPCTGALYSLSVVDLFEVNNKNVISKLC